VSERDCLRRVVLAGKPPEAIAVRDIMIKDVVKVEIEATFAECLRLMHAHGIRHLPVLAKDKVVGVVSIRDLLREAVDHHAKIIGELERERMTMTTSMV
jgi:CBS domain-containing protein